MQQDTMQCLERMISIFDLELESFGVEMGPLREPAVECVFWAWVED
jgi:hypothetical protein